MLQQLLKRRIKMIIQEAFNSNKWFKRPCWKHSFKRADKTVVKVDNKDIHFYLNEILSVKDILADDYILKKEWYEGDFKKKYPNGVWCWVWDKEDDKIKAVVTNYDKDVPYPFVTTSWCCYKYAKPLTKKEAKEITPAIIEGEV